MSMSAGALRFKLLDPAFLTKSDDGGARKFAPGRGHLQSERSLHSPLAGQNTTPILNEGLTRRTNFRRTCEFMTLSSNILLLLILLTSRPASGRNISIRAVRESRRLSPATLYRRGRLDDERWITGKLSGLKDTAWGRPVLI